MSEETKKQVDVAINDLIDAIVREQPRKIQRAERNLKWLAMDHGVEAVANRWEEVASFAVAYWVSEFEEQTENLRFLAQFQKTEASDAA